MPIILHSDEPESQVYGSIFGGIFDGNIHTKDGVFYVEKISKYPTQFKNISGKIHSIIYHSENVIDPFENHHPGKLQPFYKVIRFLNRSTWLIIQTMKIMCIVYVTEDWSVLGLK